MNFIEFLTEKQDKEPKNAPDRRIFMKNMDGELVLRETVLKYFANEIDKIDELIPIIGAYVVGDLLKRIYTDNSPVDVVILMDREDIDEVIHDRLLSVIETANQTFVADTLHPLHLSLKLVNGDSGAKAWLKRQENVFDIEKNRIIKATEPESDDIMLAMAAIRENEPAEIIIIDRPNPIKIEFIQTYELKSLEKIKMALKNKLFDLTREANGISDGSTEKAFVKDALTNRSVNLDKLQLKYSEGDVSPQLALNLLKQKYYYEILDMISSIKADESVESDFGSALTKKIAERQMEEREEKRPTFMEFVLTEDKKHIKKLKKLANLVEPGKGYKSNRANKKDRHENLGLEMRSMRRKKLRQLAAYRELTRNPIREVSDEFSCKNIINRAKDIAKGIWPVTPMQARWIAFNYHFDMPTGRDRIKRLSNMPMALFKSRRGKMFLVKDPALKGIS